jgi:Protein of unknown function (DUF3383)
MATNTVDISDFVNATLTISPIATPFENFGLGLALGDSNVIDVSQRWRTYSTILEVEQDFGTSAPEYLAATVYFGQSPQPAQLLIGRWARTATSGLLHGASLTPSQQVISNFTSVTSGAFFIMIDGVPYAASGLNFASALNLNGVASAVQTALNGLDAGTKCVFGANNSRFDIVSPTTGITSSVSYGAPPTALGSASFSGQPTGGTDSITLGGTAVAFVTGTPTGNQVQVGSSLTITLQNLVTFLNGSADTNISKCNYSVIGSVLYYWFKVTGSTGNSFTTARVSSVITLSGSTLAGGSGTDVSTLLGLTQASGASPPVPGIAAESALQGMTALATANSQWYQVAFASSVTPAVSDYEACGAFIQASARHRIFGVTINTSDCLDPTNTSDLASNLQSLDLDRTFWWYDPSNPYGVFTMMGRAATINFNGSQTTITLAYKQAPGLQGAFLNETQFATLKGKGGNCNIVVNNGAVMIYPGQMSNAKYIGGQLTSGNWFDEIQDCDWFLNFVQTNVFNLLFGTTTKIPQTDAGDNIIAATISNSCQQAVVNGMAAPGVWQAAGFGSLQTGDTLANGYYVYYPPIATQSAADRAARISVPFQVAIKLAGAIHQVDLIVNVNR